VRAKAWFLAFVLVAFGGIANSADDQDAAKKLGVLVGKWESEATVSESRFSHADKLSSSMECRWSPQSDFLICEQLITDSSGKHTQLSIYSYNAKKTNYIISTVTGPGNEPMNGTVMIKGNIWTYPGSYEPLIGKKTLVRTINDFSVSGTDSFKTEFSDDDGAHWTVTLQGKGHKIQQ
jgi:hypothetical protein